MLSASAHKFYGPEGLSLVRRSSAQLRNPMPLAFGGGQERGLRPGPNVRYRRLGVAAEIAGEYAIEAAHFSAQFIKATQF